MNKMIAVIISLALIATPALACVGPSCLPTDGTIDTYFKGSGWNVYFNDATIVDERIDDDMIVEDVWTMKGDVTVLQNINIDDKWFGSSEVILNKQITVDPSCWFSANVEKSVIWDGTGEVYRMAELGDVTNIVHVGASEGTFVDDIRYEGTLNVFESVGLNTETTCVTPHLPDMPDMPICDWCRPLV